MSRLNDTAAASPDAAPLRFLIVDDQPIVSFALRQILTSPPGWQILAHVPTPDEARDALTRHSPDIVVLNLLYPDVAGYDFIRWVAANHAARTVVYSTQPASIYARRCIHAGARGYIARDTSIEDLFQTMRLVAQGRTVVCGRIDEPGQTASAGADERLSRREIEILNLLGQGLSNRDIARRLCRSDKTVESHRYRIVRKLNLASGRELNDYARRCVLAGTFEPKHTFGAAADRDPRR